MSSRIITAVTAALLAAGLGGAAPVATASSGEPVSDLHLDDPTGDVYTGPGTEPRRGRSVDLVATDIRRLERRMVLRFSYDDLSQQGMQDLGVAFEIPRRYDHLYISWYASRDSEGVWSDDGAGSISKVDSADEFPVRCPALRGTPDYDADTLTLRVPQACFPTRGIVIENLLADGRRLHQGEWLTDSPFGDLDDPYGTRTPRLMAPAS